jgi:hypothetical protein
MRTAAAAGIFAALQAGPALVPAYEPTGFVWPGARSRARPVLRGGGHSKVAGFTSPSRAPRRAAASPVLLAIAISPLRASLRLPAALLSLIITFMFEPAKLQMNLASERGQEPAPLAGRDDRCGSHAAACSASASALEIARAARIRVRWLKALLAH